MLAIPNYSGTIAVGGTAQMLVGRNDDRRPLFLQNLHPTEKLWVCFGDTAGPTEPSVIVPPDGGSITTDFTGMITIYSATTGHTFTCLGI